MLLPDTDSETALKIAHTLLQSIAEMTPSSKQGPSSISCSIGLATLVPTPEISSDELIKAADKALYKAKEDGRNRCCTFDGDWHCLSSS